MGEERHFTAETTLALLGGAVILLVGILSFAATPFTVGGMRMMGSWGRMGVGDMMNGLGMTWINMGAYGLIGIVSGLSVIIAAFMLNARPTEHITWGAVILALSIVSFIDSGGVIIGAVLGIVAGALALSRRYQQNPLPRTQIQSLQTVTQCLIEPISPELCGRGLRR